ncbi:uncharacterized protein G2W53_042945 [Senna tora]|uniref:Uncharacterized protein n=1 Tax=Senna tora TaxID=362788 RepID=A0A834SUR9_9FABA|nr:uncharacterized protein G2W53_042945 [Senna tora]
MSTVGLYTSRKNKRLAHAISVSVSTLEHRTIFRR